MKFFKNKSKKLTLMIIFLILFNFTVPTYSQAGLDTTLINPIKDFIILVCDGVLGIMQGVTLGDYSVTTPSNVARNSTPGLGEFARFINNISFGAVASGSNLDEFDDRAKIIYTPFEIFTNKIPAFDVNFFSSFKQKPKVYKISGQMISEEEKVKYLDSISRLVNPSSDYDIKQMRDDFYEIGYFIMNSGFYNDYDLQLTIALLDSNYVGKGDLNYFQQCMIRDYNLEYYFMTPKEINQFMCDYHDFGKKYFSDFQSMKSIIVRYYAASQDEKYKEDFKDAWKGQVDNSITSFEDIKIVDVLNQYPSYQFTPALLGVYLKNAQNNSVELTSTASILKTTISKWYYILLNISIICMLSVLVYIGIRILVSSASKDKAKYKQMLRDWLVGLLLLFFIHYIMSFSFYFVEQIISLLKNVSSDSISFFNDVRDYAGIQSNPWFALGYTVMYIVLVCITIYFTVIYLRRVIYLAFLTLIAPVVAFTYPIDKINDGSAQAFNGWLREYLFNLLIQPMHLILYTVLIGTASDLANVNIIYSMVALGFITQAEKLARKFFGFEKAQTPGILSGPAGGVLMMEGFRKMTGWGPGQNRNKKTDNRSSSSNSTSNKIKTKSVDAYDTMLNNNNNNNNNVVSTQHTPTTGNQAVPGTSPQRTQGTDPQATPRMSTQETAGTTPQVAQETTPQETQGTDPQATPRMSTQETAGTTPQVAQETTPQVAQGTTPQETQGMRTQATPRMSTQETAGTTPQVAQGTTPQVAQGTTPQETQGMRTQETQGMRTQATPRMSTQEPAGTTPQRTPVASPQVVTNGVNTEQDSRFKTFRNRVNNTRVGRALEARSQAYGRGLRRKIKNYAKNDWRKSHPLGAGLKFTAQLASGIGMGALGLGIGIATGSPRQALQNTIIGTRAGTRFTGNIADKIGASLNVDGTDEAARAAYHGDEYKAFLQRQQYKEWLEKNEEILIRNLGSEQYRLLRDNRTFQEYNNYGIEDVSEIIACEKFKEKNPQFDTESAISTLKIANQIGDYKNLSAKQQGEANDTLRKNFKNSTSANNVNLSDQQLDEIVAKQIRYINDINSYKDII